MAMAAKGFVSKHPWMTFFLALAALGTAQVVLARKNTVASPSPQPQPGPMPGTPPGPGAPSSYGMGVEEPPPDQGAPAPSGIQNFIPMMPPPARMPPVGIALLPPPVGAPQASGFRNERADAGQDLIARPRRVSPRRAQMPPRRFGLSDRERLGRYEG